MTDRIQNRSAALTVTGDKRVESEALKGACNGNIPTRHLSVKNPKIAMSVMRKNP